jgi:hypothetical protein
MFFLPLFQPSEVSWWSFGALELWRAGHVAARVSVSYSAFRGRDENLKEEYKGSLKIGSG